MSLLICNKEHSLCSRWWASLYTETQAMKCQHLSNITQTLFQLRQLYLLSSLYISLFLLPNLSLFFTKKSYTTKIPTYFSLKLSSNRKPNYTQSANSHNHQLNLTVKCTRNITFQNKVSPKIPTHTINFIHYSCRTYKAPRIANPCFLHTLETGEGALQFLQGGWGGVWYALKWIKPVQVCLFVD